MVIYACIQVLRKQRQVDSWCWPGSLAYLTRLNSMMDCVSKIGGQSLRINTGGYSLATHAHPPYMQSTHIHVFLLYRRSFSVHCQQRESCRVGSGSQRWGNGTRGHEEREDGGVVSLCTLSWFWEVPTWFPKCLMFLVVAVISILLPVYFCLEY